MSIKYRTRTGDETPGYRNYSAGVANNVANVVTTWPTNCANGDCVVLFLATNNATSASYTHPTGWSVLSYDSGATFTGMTYAVYVTTYFDDKSPPTINISPGAQPAGYWIMAAFKGVKFSSISVASGGNTTNYPEQTGTDGQVVLLGIHNGPFGTQLADKDGFTGIYWGSVDSSYDVGIKMQYASSASNIGNVGLATGHNYFAISAYLEPGGGAISNLEDIFVPRGTFITQESRLMGWGDGYSGMLGLASNANYLLPAVVSKEKWSVATTGDSASGAITPDGALWVTGQNTYGTLGIPSISIGVSSLVRVGSLNDWKSIVFGTYIAVATKTDNSLWSWGYNASGQLGLGDLVNRSSPVRIGALNTWQSVNVGAGPAWNNVYVLAVKSDLSLWAWGSNPYGQLGHGNVLHRSSPVQVGSLLTWAQVAGNGGAVIARTNTGQLWAWGYNASGQLGLGDVVSRSSPVRIGALNDWSKVSVGNVHAAAIKTDGSLWTWGQGINGKLGLGNTADKSSPTRVGALNDWADVLAGDHHTIARKNDGTVWAWGDNSYGQLGMGDTIDRSSPVQITSLANSVRSLQQPGSELTFSMFVLTY